jgi:PAS domain S-box-containing protein
MRSTDEAQAKQFTTPIPLDRDIFMRRLITSLGHLNEGILGSDLTGAYIMNVGLSMGAAIEEEYKRFWGIDRSFTLDEYAHVIVDLKQKIQGNFSLVSKDPQKVVVRTTSCPFDSLVHQSPSLCFMTSSVFGGIAARNFGYAKVVLHQRIALGDPGCLVTVYLQRTPEAQAAIGKEYAPDVTQASPDIAEQLHLMEQVKNLRKQLSESSSRWEEVMEEAAEAIAAIDLSGRVIYANARWRDLLGVEGEEIIGNILEQLVPTDDQPGVHNVLEQAAHGKRVSGHRFRLRHRNGALLTLRMSVGAIRDDRGLIVGTLGIVRDITEEYEAQRLKDELLTTTSHELRTPVTTIRGMTQLLLRSLEQGEIPGPEMLARRLQIIQRETDRLARLSSDLTDAAKLQTGALALHRERYDLRTIVEELIVIQRELPGVDGRWTLNLQLPEHALSVRVDRTRIEQVLINLLDNARKYSPDGGPITITLRKEGQEAQIAITDTGIGIPEQDVPHLFTPFFRATNASSCHFPGVGLGLYLCQSIMHAHEGRITVTSREGSGTTFVLSLPCEIMESGEVQG